MKRDTTFPPPARPVRKARRGMGQDDGIGPGRALPEDGPDPYRRAMHEGQGPQVRERGGYGGQYAGLSAGSPEAAGGKRLRGKRDR